MLGGGVWLDSHKWKPKKVNSSEEKIKNRLSYVVKKMIKGFQQEIAKPNEGPYFHIY